MDITEIPLNLKDLNNKKYILNIIDHFSKLCKSYLLEDKKSIGILNCFKQFILEFGIPLSVGTDNGREFKNKLLSDYMKDNNIKYVHGLPYKPHSQGVCERVHKTIKTSLLIKKLENNNNFNIEKSLEDINKEYNKTIHNVTKASPYEIFFSTNDKYFKNIKQNIINYYKKKDKILLDIDLEDKVLINSNILIKRNKKENLIIVEKNKVKTNSNIYTILGEVIKIHDSGVYDILITKDYKDDNLDLKINDICRISHDLFKVIDYNIWNKLNNDNN